MAFSSLYQLMLTICISGFQVLALDEQSRQDWNLLWNMTERASSGNVRHWQIKSKLGCADCRLNQIFSYVFFRPYKDFLSIILCTVM